MIYQKYQKSMKAIGAAVGLLAVAACSDGGGEDGRRVDQDALLEANNAVEGKETGTWGDIVYGSADAPVTIVEYASLTCPHCATFSKTTFPKLKEEFIDTGKVRFIYRNYVMNGIDMIASTVARCRDEETTKRLMTVFFSRQGEWARAQDINGAMASIARRTANMSRSEFDKCASNREMMANLTEMTKIAQQDFQVGATPTIFVEGLDVADFRWENLKGILDEATAN